ncbi:hypothetical protein G7Z17_g2441 [Cylindrodendrum hubeiense]|uniref:Quinate/shikimate 5-dehydrogenase/glutamyl-tRNA reductase domain-containing protein n=1 Tax=Cylindrodendrum hubeiense TaxID=595255 RepID=A0A9P5LEG6_9HYPO|nr:hypothetical protein G7Z17_g2441 [Cylindrodendrum hubeiense]
MSNFIVLGDSAVHELLIGLSKPEIITFQHELEKAMMHVSVGKESEYQPSPGIVNRPNGQVTLFRPFTSPEIVGAKLVVDSAAVQDTSGGGKGPSLQGIVALCDSRGLPVGIINAEELTGYRTSLSAMIPYMWRRYSENIVVFGAGRQALWHIRLALALRGSEIKSITVVNRSEARARSLLSQVEEENRLHWKSSSKLDVLDTSQPGSDRRLELLLSDVDVVFCTVPSTSPIFPSRYIVGGPGRKRYPFISAIGSWQPDMIELDPEIIRHVVNSPEGYNPSGGSGGAIIVDDRKEVLIKAGEVIQSGISASQMVEVGEVLNWRQGSHMEQAGGQEKLVGWLETGFVVFKVIGVSITDLAAGKAILDLAKERGVGTAILDF